MEKTKIRKAFQFFDSQENFLARDASAVSSQKITSLVNSFYTPGPSFQYIFDFANRKFVYVGGNLKETLGAELENLSVEEYTERFHPNDMRHFLHCEEIAAHFLFHLIDKEERQEYKVSYQIRLKDKNGEYGLYLRQSIAISLDEDYKFIYVFTNNSDISHITKTNNRTVSFLHINGGKSYYGISNVEDLEEQPTKSKISNREMEILRLVSEGYSSKEIGEYLHISRDTVRTHRRNILNKTKFKNLTQAVTHYVREGLL